MVFYFFHTFWHPQIGPAPVRFYILPYLGELAMLDT